MRLISIGDLVVEERHVLVEASDHEAAILLHCRDSLDALSDRAARDKPLV